MGEIRNEEQSRRANRTNSAANNKSKNRRSRKKRRTEVSSSEEASSSSSSSDDSDHEKEVESMAEPEDTGKTDHPDVQKDREDMEIDQLQIVDGSAVGSIDAAVAQTRDQLRLIDVATGGVHEPDNAALDTGAWLGQCIHEHGDDVNALREAGDFREGSVALVAQLLRESGNIFREV